MTYVYAYMGATCEDVYNELENTASDRTSLEIMASPRAAFISTEYSEELVMELAEHMWDEIAEYYARDLDRPFATRAPLTALRMVTTSKECRYPSNFKGELPIKEITTVQFFGEADFDNTDELMRVVVQKHSVRLPKQRVRTLAEVLPDFGTSPGDSGNAEE